MGMNLADFTENNQESFMRGFADAVGVPRDRVRITYISSRDTTLRRLLVGGIRVATEAVVADEGQGASAVAQLTPELLNAQMSKYGLSGVEVLQIATVATVRVAAGAAPNTLAYAATPTPAPATGGVVVQLSVVSSPPVGKHSVGWWRKHAALLAAIVCAVASAVLFGIVSVIVCVQPTHTRSQSPIVNEHAEHAAHRHLDYSYQNVPCLHCHNMHSMHAAL